MIVATIGVQITDQVRWAAARDIAHAWHLVALTGLFVLTLAHLYYAFLQVSKKVGTVESKSKTKDSLERRHTQGVESVPMTMASKSEISNQSRGDSTARTSEESKISKSSTTTDCSSTPANLGMITKTSSRLSLAKSRQSRRAEIEHRNKKVRMSTRNTLRKIGFRICAIVAIVCVAVPFMVLSIIRRFEEGGTYSERINSMAGKYSPTDDIVEYVLVVLTSFAVFYTAGQ